MDPGNHYNNAWAAPYLRTETLEYTERETSTLHLIGRNRIPFDGFDLGDLFTFQAPELDWVVSWNTAKLNQPDKRQFGSFWLSEVFVPGFPPYWPDTINKATYLPFLPAENINLGFMQRIWKEIEERGEQYSMNLRFPFEQYSDLKGYLKFGLFKDDVNRKFNQDTFNNGGGSGANSFEGEWDDFWSEQFPDQDNPIQASEFDVDYRGDIELSAWYAMIDMPLFSSLSMVGGARHESTDISIVNYPGPRAIWYPPWAVNLQELHPGDADVDFSQDDWLPSLALVYQPLEELTLRASYSETVARQTFKELTPIFQQEYAGGPIFIGNPLLEMSNLDNYDLRCDLTPYEEGLFSFSLFRKNVENPIEYVQRVVSFTYTTAKNYPEGKLQGYELEARQGLGVLWEKLNGFSLGGNATFIDSEVTLPDDEIAEFNHPNVQAPINNRDMTNAPEHIYNLYTTYDIEASGTKLALFYTVQGDTLVAGAGVNENNFVPSVYAKEYATLNFSLLQKLGQYLSLKFQAKNLTNPKIEEVYRSGYIGDDVTKTRYTKGIEYSIGLIAEFRF